MVNRAEEVRAVSWVGVALLVFASICILSNWLIVIKWIFWRAQNSLVPLVGGGLGLIGLWLYVGFGYWVFFPLVIDIGSFPMLIGALYYYGIRGRFAGNSS